MVRVGLGALLVTSAWVACTAPGLDGDSPSTCANCALPSRPTDSDTGTPDGGDGPRVGGGTDGAADGAPLVLRCSPTTPFGPPKLVPGIDPNRHASSPHLSPDEKVVYFTSQDPNVAAQVYRASRASTSDPFGAVEPVPGINSDSNDNDPTISADGLTLVFHTGRVGAQQDVWWAKRTVTTAEFGTPSAVPSIATGSYEGQGFFHVASNELWFVSNRDGTFDIFRAKRNGDAFDPPSSVTEVSSAQDDFLPFLSEDGLTIYFSSTRVGTKGGQDLYLATRPTAMAPFGTPVPIDELNTDAGEQAGSLSPDGCRIYFSRTGGPGGQQIWVAERAF